jgi:hypothetical protein
MNKTELIYTPELIGSGQFGVCQYCGLPPTSEGHDGCLGVLDESVVMNACCGHGDISQAYIQYWNSSCIRGEDAVRLICKLKTGG